MNEIYINNAALPVLCGCGSLTAGEPFYHADRTVDFNVLIYVTEGCIYVTENDCDYELRAEELLFLKSGVRHFGKHPCPRGTCWHYAHFILSDKENLSLYDFLPPSSKPLEYAAMLPKHTKIPQHSEIAHKIRALTSHFEQPDKMSGWQLNAELFGLLSELCFMGSLNRTLTVADKAEEFLRSHRRESFSAAALEREFNLSYKWLAALFKKEKNITMQQYPNSCRMEDAAALLRTTLLTVGEIAWTLGFEDPLYFSRCFRERFGLSPTQYRKANLLNY